MKANTNKYLPLSLAVAGVVIAGAVLFFASTKKGRKAMNKWSAKGKQMSGEIKEIINDAKEKIQNLKKEMLQDCVAAGPEKDVLQA